MKLVTDLDVTSRSVRTGTGVSPVALFGTGEDGLFLDVAVVATAFTTHDQAFQAAVGNSVGRLEDLSGNVAHATQSISAARPILARVPRSGLRNHIRRSQEFDDSAWNKVSGAVVVPRAEGFLLVDDTANTTGFPQMTQAPAMVAGDWTFWVEAEADQTPYLVLTDQDGSARASIFDLSDGSIGSQHAAHSASVTPLGGGRYRCAITFSRSGGGGNVRVQLSSNRSANSGTPRTGLHSVILHRIQLEPGSMASGYQHVRSAYDITETGQPDLWHLFNDGIDDALTSTLPDLGNDVTVAYATDFGVTIKTAQTIGAGGFDVLRDTRLFAILVIDRALSSVEFSRVTRFLKHRAGGYAA